MEIGRPYLQIGEKGKSVTVLNSAISAGLPEALAKDAAQTLEGLNKK